MARPRTAAADYQKMLLRIPVPMLEECKKRIVKSKRSLNAELVATIEHGLLFEETLQLKQQAVLMDADQRRCAAAVGD